MAKQAEPKEVSVGVCRFCEQEFAKSKMTQHLKTCKVRQGEMDKQEGDKEQLFHLFIEGKYRPDYWMHLEVPAGMTLSDLDDFLRAIWLECCGHLSEFEIDGVSYSAAMEDDLGINFGGLQLVSNDGTEGEEDEDEAADEGTMPSMEEMAAEISQQVASEFKTDLKDVPLEQIEQRLEQMFAENMPPGMSAVTMPTLRPFLNVMAQSLQQGTLAQDLENAEEEDEDDDGMDIELGDVLEVGTKFSYVYDFGSSSTLSLRVLAERDGMLPADDEEEEEDEDYEEEEDTIDLVVMARNEPPALKCHVCGKPATHVPSVSEYDVLAEVALCETHAEESEDPDELLPLVNSPRTGICAYAGDDEEDGWDGEEWDENDEDDE